MGSLARTIRTAANPYRVLIAGGCYSGLSAAVNLIRKCDSPSDSPIPVAITIVDERDGYCMSARVLAVSPCFVVSLSYTVHYQIT